MRRLPLLVAAFALGALAPLPLSSQLRLSPFVGGGMGVGLGDLSENTNNGWLAYAGVDALVAAHSGLTIGVTGLYAHVPYQGGFSEATNLTGAFIEIGYLIGAKSTSFVKPYVRAGAGVLQFKYDQGNTGYNSTTNTGAAISGGAGFVLDLSPAQLFLGAHVVVGSEGGLLGLHGGIGYAIGGGSPRSR